MLGALCGIGAHRCKKKGGVEEQELGKRKEQGKKGKDSPVSASSCGFTSSSELLNVVLIEARVIRAGVCGK